MAKTPQKIPPRKPPTFTTRLQSLASTAKRLLTGKAAASTPVKRKPPGLSLDQLFNNAYSTSRTHVKWVSLFQAKAGTIDGCVGIRATTLTAEPGERPRRHKLYIRARDPSYEGTLYRCPAVYAQCDCMDWMHRWEYAMARRGGSFRGTRQRRASRADQSSNDPVHVQARAHVNGNHP